MHYEEKHWCSAGWETSCRNPCQPGSELFPSPLLWNDATAKKWDLGQRESESLP